MEFSSELMTSPEVSRLLKVSIRTVHRRVEAGELAAAQKLPGPNGAYLFRPADVEHYLAQQDVSAGEPASGDDARASPPDAAPPGLATRGAA